LVTAFLTMLNFVSKHLIPFFILRISNLGRVPELLINSEKRILPCIWGKRREILMLAFFS